MTVLLVVFGLVAGVRAASGAANVIVITVIVVGA